MPSASTLHRIQQIQVLSIGWMGIEAVVSLGAAWIVGSLALLAFGGDSAIELFSASLVLWRFRGLEVRESTERRVVDQIAGGLLLALAAYVVVGSVLALLGHAESRPSYIGIAVLMAAVTMRLLAREKRKLSAQTDSAALRADAAESAFCGYLSLGECADEKPAEK